MDRFDMPPQHDGQAKTMLICDGPKTVPAERGHWYSPEKVLELLAAEREACAKVCEEHGGSKTLNGARLPPDGSACARAIRLRSNMPINRQADLGKPNGEAKP